VIRVQQEDFDIGAEVAKLTAGAPISARSSPSPAPCATRTGAVEEMTLEHYPGMTERELSRIEAEAQARWPLAGEPCRASLW
jgi:molybdopterin synthase catalytic subunit